MLKKEYIAYRETKSNAAKLEIQRLHIAVKQTQAAFDQQKQKDMNTISKLQRELSDSEPLARKIKMEVSGLESDIRSLKQQISKYESEISSLKREKEWAQHRAK